MFLERVFLWHTNKYLKTHIYSERISLWMTRVSNKCEQCLNWINFQQWIGKKAFKINSLQGIEMKTCFDKASSYHLIKNMTLTLNKVRGWEKKDNNVDSSIRAIQAINIILQNILQCFKNIDRVWWCLFDRWESIEVNEL